MDPVYAAGHEPENQRYTSNFDFQSKHQESLTKVFVGALVLWVTVYIVFKVIRDSLMNSACAKDPNSHWQHIKKLDSGQKWLHVSYFVSILHALTLLVLQSIATFQCSPPAKYANPNDGFFSNTVYTNDWCVDNGNWWECACTLVFMAYLFVDCAVCICLMQDNSVGMMQNYLHHTLGIVGTVTCMTVGRMILTLSNITCITEVSTPFVSMRAVLSMHKQTSSTAYMINGLVMTVSFFFFRVCFQAYIVTFKLFPAMYYRSDEMLAEVDDSTRLQCYFSCTMYMVLTCLNCYWFNLMFMGLMKFFNKKKEASKTE